jgi:hypothetical protein
MPCIESFTFKEGGGRKVNTKLIFHATGEPASDCRGKLTAEDEGSLQLRVD